MAGLRIAYTPHELRLIAPGEDGHSLAEKRSPPLQYGEEAAAKDHAASVTKDKRPSVDPLAFPRQSISPALAARIYQANIISEVYTYPLHVSPEGKETVTGSDNARGGHDPGENHAAAVTMIRYEPGALVDCHA